jgi:hypothetical protein
MQEWDGQYLPGMSLAYGRSNMWDWDVMSHEMYDVFTITWPASIPISLESQFPDDMIEVLYVGLQGGLYRAVLRTRHIHTCTVRYVEGLVPFAVVRPLWYNIQVWIDSVLEYAVYTYRRKWSGIRRQPYYVYERDQVNNCPDLWAGEFSDFGDDEWDDDYRDFLHSP